MDKLSARNDQMLDMLLADMVGGGNKENANIDFRAYWHIVVKHKWGILSLTLVAALLSFFYVSTLVPKYQAVATLLYDPPSVSNYGTVRDLTAMESYNSAFRDYRLFKAQQMIVGSRQFAEGLVDHYQLWTHPFIVTNFDADRKLPEWKLWVNNILPEWAPRFEPPPRTAAKPGDDEAQKNQLRDGAISVVVGGMSLNTQEDVMLLKLGFVSSDPDFAAEMANKLAEFYGQYELDQRMAAFDRATKWLVERTQELRSGLIQSEEKLQNFKETEEVGLLGSGSNIASTQLEDVLANLSAANKRVQTLSQTLARLDRQETAAESSVDGAELVRFPGVRKAMEAEMEARKSIDQLAQVYGPKHPKMIQAVNVQQNLEQKLQSEIRLVTAALESDLDVAKSNQQRLSQEFEKLKNQVQEFEKKSFKLDALERAKKTDQELYDLFVTRFKELNIGSDVSSTSVKLIDEARRPGAAFWPNKTKIVGMFSILAFALGISLAFFLEYLDKTIKSPDQVEGKLGVPLLGSLEQVESEGKGEEIKAESLFIDKNKSLFAEGIRTIRTGVMLSGLDNPYKIIAVTSTVPGEGKTTMSINLACALGQLEKVLLIDADMRQAALGPHFGYARNVKGLSDVTAGLASFADCVHTYEKGSIDILTAGTIPPNPQELLSSDKFKHLLEEVSSHYDRVIIDTAPTHLVSDPKLVARWASALIYVVRAETTYAHVAASEIKELKKINKPIIGVVLNGVMKDKLFGIYRYGGYRRRGYGYGRYGQYGAYGQNPDAVKVS